MKNIRLKKQVLDRYLRRIRKEVSVHFVSEKKMEELNGNGSRTVIGLYDPNLPKRIYVENTLPNYTKLNVLLHEYGHFLHDMDECKCSAFHNRKLSNPVLCEIHAERYCLSKLHNDQMWECLKIEKRLLKKNWDNFPHSQALKRLMKSKTWKLRRK